MKYVPYQNPEHEFIVSVAGSVAWGDTGNASIGADQFSLLTAKAFFGKGFDDLDIELLRPFAVTGEMDFTWSTHPIDFIFDPTMNTLSVTQRPTVLTYGATLQYSLLYMNSFVHARRSSGSSFPRSKPFSRPGYRTLVRRSSEQSLERMKLLARCNPEVFILAD